MKNNPLQILKPFPLTTMQYGKGLLMTLLTAFALFFTGSLHAQSNTNTPIASYYSVAGKSDYQVIGSSELIETNGLGNCGVVGATSKTLTIPAGATIVKAYVHWYAMTRNTTNIGPAYQPLGNISFQAPGATAVTLNATAIPAFASFAGGFINVEGKKVDVTAALQALANPNGTYSVDINGGFPDACPLNEANTRAWTLTVVYTTTSGASQKINLFDGLVGILGNTSITNVSGYAVPTTGSTAGNLTGVFLQGDPGITGESSITSDPSFPDFPTDFGNSTTGAALDIDVLTGNFTAGSTNMNITTSTSGDFIVAAEYAIKIPCTSGSITAGPTPAAQTVVQNGTVTPLSVTATGTGLTYQWYNNGTTNNNTGGTAIGGATSSNYTPSSATVGTTYYYVVVTGACGPVFSSVASVTVPCPAGTVAPPVN